MDGYAEYDNFSRLDIRVGEIKSVEVFSEAKKPAYKLYIFFGDEIGIKKSSAQIRNYSVDELVRQEGHSSGTFQTEAGCKLCI
jgi:EMAP domain